MATPSTPPLAMAGKRLRPSVTHPICKGVGADYFGTKRNIVLRTRVQSTFFLATSNLLKPSPQ
jgi:hypothetical protein